MSAQTGVETPRGPASRRIGDRVKFRFDRWRAEPNPLWMREMRQSARLLRTPLILMVLTLLVTLLMASLGGVQAGSSSPAKVGVVLFHVFFSLAWFVVTLVGPALAANGIASEREGKTWEAVLLTGMQAKHIASGKFWSAFTAIAMYIVMLAPVGALPFLFGGVTPVEVLIAFIFLMLIALLSVAFGLAVSAKMQSLRGALLVTLLVAVPLSGTLFMLMGVGLSEVAHDTWRAIPRELPVWLPTAYVRAPFGLRYVVYLIALPMAAIALPAWLLYEITRANLTSQSDDRSLGLKRWFVVASVVLTMAALVPLFDIRPRDRSVALIGSMCCYCLFIAFNTFLFSGEPIGPSRRVKKRLATAGALRRFLAPGAGRVGQLQVLVSVMALIALATVGVIYVNTSGAPRATVQSEQIIVFAVYAAGFSIFMIGLSSFLRARTSSAMVARVLLLVMLFLITVGPWILAAMTGAVSGSQSPTSASWAVAAPSPVYVFIAVFEALPSIAPGVAIIASVGASLGYAIIGLMLLALASHRCGEIVREHDLILAEADRRLAAEDALIAAQYALADQAALAQLEHPAAPVTDSEHEPEATGADDEPQLEVQTESSDGDSSETDLDEQAEQNTSSPGSEPPSSEEPDAPT